MHKEVITLFREFQKMPKMALVDGPAEYVPAYSNFVFTRRTLKHLAEKGEEGWRLLQLVSDILEFPDCILRETNNRIMYVKYFPGMARPHLVVIESEKIIVTAFLSKKKYLKNFEILWRTRSSLP
ncbi:MAG: hypothetical protein NT077_01890 [Candidatus Taylorbacteria bacterium]|nr:hypothetical protein [Candidatus Taylorbacteria bacterium]